MRQSAACSQMWSSFPRTCDGTSAGRWPEGLGRQSPQGKPTWVRGEKRLSPGQGWVLGWLRGSGWHRAAAGQRGGCAPTGGGQNPDRGLFPSVPHGLLRGMPQRWQPHALPRLCNPVALTAVPGLEAAGPRAADLGAVGKPAGKERGALALPPPLQDWHRWLRKGSAHE